MVRSPIGAYGAALAALVGALFLRWLLDPLLAGSLPLATLSAAVGVAVWVGGYRPALLVLGVGSLAYLWLFLIPQGLFGADSPRTLVGLGSDLLSLALIIGFGGALRSTQMFDRTERESAREALRQSEEKFRTLADNMSQFAWMADEQGWIFWYNRRWYEFTGTTLEQMQGWGWQKVHHPEHVQRVVDKIRACFKSGEVWEDTFPLRGKDGTYRWFLSRAIPIRDEAGRVIRWFGTNTDITAQREAEQRLVRERELLQTIIDRIPVMLTLYHPDTRLLRLNPEFERVTGWSDAEAAGVSLMEQCYPDPMYRAQVGEFMQSCRDGWMDLRMRKRDGGDVETSWANIRLSDNTQVGIGIDITDRKRAEQALRVSEERLNLALDAAGLGLWDWNVGSGEVLWNTHHETIFGYTPGQPRRSYRDFANRLPPEELAQVEAGFRRALQEGREFRFEHRVIWPDGTTRWVESFGRFYNDPDGKPLRSVGVLLDVTERKQAEEALRRLNAELQLADRRKDDFLATLAHELRNPLAPIRNAVQVFKAKGPPDPELMRCRDLIDRQVGHMVRLLEDLLDVSRITRNKLELRKSRVSLAAVVESAVETSRPLIESGQHELVLRLPTEPVILDADPVRLAQVFSNLLNNAAKYTERGGRIQLAAQRQGNAVLVTVTDNGIGIATETLPRLFEMFSQAKPALERSQGGLGIGLALVKGLVEMHGGCIEARSGGPGLGSDFIVRLPLLVDDILPDGVPSGEDAEPGRGTKWRLLIVDDLKDSADSLALLLELLGHEVRTAYDGAAAIVAAESFLPDVVLLDLGMPKVNGYEVCRHIRNQPWGKGMFLIALTGWGQENDRRRTEAAGFDHHLVKPADSATLVKLLASLPRQQESQKTGR
jgi:PAS domain S-box-containing protein